MTKAQYKSLISWACSKFLHNNPSFNTARLTGRNHIDRSVVAHEGFARLIPERYKTSMSFGVDRLDVIPTLLAKMIGKELGIPHDFFSSEMHSYGV